MWYLPHQEGGSLIVTLIFAQIMPKFWNLPHVNWEFPYIFFTFVKNLPHRNGKSPSYRSKHYHMYAYLMANSADPDQLASSEANWSGSTPFAKAGYIRVQQDKG